MSQEELRRAHALIERGRTAEARQILETLDDPTARQWLAQLNAARRPRKGGFGVPLPVLVAVGVVIGIAVLIVILLLTPTLLSRMQNRTEDTATQGAVDEALYASILQYCMVTTGYGGEEPCMSWTELVLDQYREAAATCISPASTNSPEAREQANDCLSANGIPEPL
ncbi:MAG: hypothetical protein IT319_18830 [Anaerolineae bacterium]|nr:hypothetical protein [Anaerolineae bacterium]